MGLIKIDNMECPYYHKCGSCAYSLSDYRFSLQDKVKNIRAKMKSFSLGEIFPAQEEVYYRHKIIYHFSMKNGQLIAGFHPRSSRAIFEVKHCYLQRKESNQLCKDIVSILRKYRQAAYNPEKRTGSLRHLLMRYSVDGKVLLCFVTATREFYGAKDIIKEIRRIHPEVVAIDHVVNSRNTSVVIEGKIRHLYGRGILLDKMKDYQFPISASSFYQVNPTMAQFIYEDTIRRLALSKEDVVADLYCGNGTISLFVAPYVHKVIGIEINPDSVENARQAAKINQISNVEFLCQDAGEVLKERTFSALIVDPPREGLSPQGIRSLCTDGPKKFAYISCDPYTLLRDLQQLEKYYHIGKINLYDQFAYTEHLEASVILERKNYEKQRNATIYLRKSNQLSSHSEHGGYPAKRRVSRIKRK